MKLTKVAKIWIMSLLLIELIVFLATFFVLSHKIVSNVFFGISAFLMCGFVYQWITFKRMNSKTTRHKHKFNERDYQLVEFYLSDIPKKNSQGLYKESDVIMAKKVQGWTFVIVIFIAILLSISIALIIGFAI